MFTDIMVDIETTGTDPDNNAMIQLAAVKFNLMTREVSSDTFDKALTFAPQRFWDESTRQWWSKMPEVYKSIVERSENPLYVLQDFSKWVNSDQPVDETGEGYRFWAKPTTFDWSFISSYYRQYGLPMPFHYRYARDLNSYMAGLKSNPQHPNIEIPFTGDEHNALWDCFHQIEQLFHAQDTYGIIEA